MYKTSIQDHVILATRLYAMAMAIYDKTILSGKGMNEEQKAAYKSLNEQADQHQHAANIFRKHTTFVMVLR